MTDNRYHSTIYNPILLNHHSLSSYTHPHPTETRPFLDIFSDPSDRSIWPSLAPPKGHSVHYLQLGPCITHSRPPAHPHPPTYSNSLTPNPPPSHPQTKPTTYPPPNSDPLPQSHHQPTPNPPSTPEPRSLEKDHSSSGCSSAFCKEG